ncbi:MAG TPA: archaeal heat shock protein Hsp20 [Candidatus Saccharimonadales bacterium]|nr:archaeal heat shock protein Hsp20 [Candidatus Saccharimonadales bacterium]
MSNRDIFPFEWYSNFINRSRDDFRRRLFGSDFFGFEDIEDEVNRVFNSYNNIQSSISKDLVREYKTEDGNNVKEVGPIVYGYSMTIGHDGKLNVREFGNVKSFSNRVQDGGETLRVGPRITTEREPLADVNSTDKEVKVILEIPGVKKEDIKINANDKFVEINANDSQRKYHKIIDLPANIDINTARSTYNNGILEITFAKKTNKNSNGREIKID